MQIATPGRYIREFLMIGQTSSATLFEHIIKEGDIYDDAICEKTRMRMQHSVLGHAVLADDGLQVLRQ